jgi:uncharacterized protein
MKRTIRLVLAAAAIATFSNAGHAQSFDCDPYLKRRQAPETVICQSPQLQVLDSEMSAKYYDLLGRLRGSAAAFLRQDQMRWLASRNSCDFNANCLVDHYRRRIQTLTSF